jgi:hypothetical protein
MIASSYHQVCLQDDHIRKPGIPSASLFCTGALSYPSIRIYTSMIKPA